jgi:hypothetical protein
MAGGAASRGSPPPSEAILMNDTQDDVEVIVLELPIIVTK